MRKKQKRGEKATGAPQKFSMMKTLRWRLTLFVFCSMIASAVLTFAIYVLVMALFGNTPWLVALALNPIMLTAGLLLVCSAIGVFVADKFGIYYLRPLRRLIAATKEVKNGNFKVQVESDNNPMSEMGTLVTNFNEMVRELDGIELFRNDFVNNFSHEFKTPIVSIRGFAKELQQQDLDEDARAEYVRIIIEESDRLAKLSTNVLELSKLENQQIVTNKTEFYLDEQLRQCILLLEGEWSRKNLEIVPELEEVRICADGEILSHVWKNLLSNAIKFTPEGGTVSVTLESGEGQVCVKIRDTGIGMSAEIMARIFEKFYQGDRSHSKQGYGIGLAMVSRALKLCGGEICVESEVGKGSTFTVTLPVEVQDSKAPAKK
jgi:signal transduction histidine kinase